MNETNKSQSDKFRKAARELGADEDEKRWEERLKKIANAKPERRTR
jgi:hypothetical protein